MSDEKRDHRMAKWCPEADWKVWYRGSRTEPMVQQRAGRDQRHTRVRKLFEHAAAAGNRIVGSKVRFAGAGRGGGFRRSVSANERAQRTAICGAESGGRLAVEDLAGRAIRSAGSASARSTRYIERRGLGIKDRIAAGGNDCVRKRRTCPNGATHNDDAARRALPKGGAVCWFRYRTHASGRGRRNANNQYAWTKLV